MPTALMADGPDLYGCSSSSSTLVVDHWDGSEFREVFDPADEQLSGCEATLAELSADPAVTTQWRVDDSRVQRSSDGLTWDRVAFDPEYLYEPYFVETGASGEVAVSHCRSEARRPDYYCYLEVSRDDGESWVVFPQVGVFAERLDERGVLVGMPVSAGARERTFSLYDYDGDVIVSTDVVPRTASVHVLDDRLVVIVRAEDGTSLQLDQYPYS